MDRYTQRVYAWSPPWIQNIGISVYGAFWKHRRFGGSFKEAVRQCVGRERFSRDEWHAYQTAQLRNLLEHAVRSIPFYRTWFTEAGGIPADVRQFEVRDVSRFPLIEKETIRRRPRGFLTDEPGTERLHAYATSGTTGTPLEIKYTASMHQAWSAAYEARCRYWAGVNHTMSRAMIGGRLVVPSGESRPPFWRYNLAERQLYLSAFHIAPANVRDYVDGLNRYKPCYLVGYASGHFFLARLIRESGLTVHQPRAVLTSSEKLTPEMRRTIEQVYGCPVFDAYSGVEACCLASECECHRLHVSPDVGLVELIGEDGKPVRDGEPGEIVATGFLNRAQPLIRYRTGDWAVACEDTCPCGRQMPILRELIGRLEDTVIGPDGREMVRFHGIFVDLPHVAQGQVIQETLTDFRVRVVADAGFGQAERDTITRRFRERLGDVSVVVDVVEKIAPTERGKFRAVISKVNREARGAPVPKA